MKMTGTVVNVNLAKGYALVRGSDRRTYFCFVRYFDEMSYFKFEDLQFGATVRFEPTEGPKGPRGVDVEILGSEQGLSSLDGI